MIICAIDPGPSESAYVQWDTDRHNFYASGEFPENKAIVSTEGMIGRIRVMTAYVDMFAIEMVQAYGMAVGRSTFETCLNVGRFMQAAYDGDPHISIQLHGRPTIKGHVGGKTDAEIRQSLRIRYGEAKKGEMLEGVVRDIWAALALATAVDENPNLKVW
jgi:hypothetical protein